MELADFQSDTFIRKIFFFLSYKLIILGKKLEGKWMQKSL